MGSIGERLFGDGGANAAGRAAMAQQEEARAGYNETKGITDRATTLSLANMDRDLKNQERNLARQEQMIAQIDPTIIEASQQALKLLRGETSSTLAPLERQRATARQKLVNQLREQLGPGAETSTAGMQALNRFDSESSNLFAGAQQQAIGQLGQTAGQFSATRPDLFREIMGMSQIGQLGSQSLFNQAGLLGNARQGLIQTAGANEVAESIRGQSNASMGRALVGAAAGGFLGGFGKQLGGAAADKVMGFFGGAGDPSEFDGADSSSGQSFGSVALGPVTSRRAPMARRGYE